MSPRSPKTLADLRVPAAIVVGAIWGLSFGIGVITNSIVWFATTTPLAMTVAMAIFSYRNGNGRNGKGGNGPHQ